MKGWKHALMGAVVALLIITPTAIGLMIHNDPDVTPTDYGLATSMAVCLVFLFALGGWVLGQDS